MIRFLSPVLVPVLALLFSLIRTCLCSGGSGGGAAAWAAAAAAGGAEVFLRDIFKFYGENSSISTENLENLLLLVSERRSESVSDGGNNPLGEQECLSAQQILTHFGLQNSSQLTLDHLDQICPAVLTQVLLPSCPYSPVTPPTSVETIIWGYGFLSVTIINLAALLGLLLVPFTRKSYFPKVLTYFIGLAIGTLFSNAVLQLIPEALGFDPKSDSYVEKAVGIFGGFYLLFLVEKILKISLNLEHEHGHSHFVSMETPLENGDSIINNSISSISSKSLDTPTSNQDAQKATVSCDWLRGQKMADIGTVAWMITLSDAVHNFIDGLAIGASFTVSVLAGFSTSIAIMCEEFPHELGDFVILLNAGMSVPQAVCFNLLSAVACYAGLVFGILLGSAFAPNVIFAIAGGMFLYIALADMFPEMENISRKQKKTSTKLVFFLIQNLGLLTGFTIILMITMFAGSISLG